MITNPISEMIISGCGNWLRDVCIAFRASENQGCISWNFWERKASFLFSVSVLVIYRCITISLKLIGLKQQTFFISQVPRVRNQLWLHWGFCFRFAHRLPQRRWMGLQSCRGLAGEWSVSMFTRGLVGKLRSLQAGRLRALVSRWKLSRDHPQFLVTEVSPWGSSHRDSLLIQQQVSGKSQRRCVRTREKSPSSIT